MNDEDRGRASAESKSAAPAIRFGLRAQLIALFTVALTAVFVAVFVWAYQFMTERTLEVLRADLDDTLAGIAKNLDGDEIAALYATGTRNAAGGSDDKRYADVMERLVEMHRVEPRAWASVLVRGDQPNTRRAGAKAGSPEFVYLVEIAPPDAQAARFLDSRKLGPNAMEAWNGARVVDIPDTHMNRFGLCMTSIGPIRDKGGQVVALLSVDFDAHDITAMRAKIRSSLITSFLFTYLVVVVLVYAAAGIFTRPIVALTRATETLDQGTLGTALALAKRPDELGALARAYNRMSARLAKAFGDLEEANDVLEQRVSERTAELSVEREKSEALLRNVLPEEIAERLKLEPGAIAEGYDAVTVLFADIVGFTTMSARSSPLAVVRLLNDIFSSFDQLADKYRLEKIKTIGDAYMIVGGLPTPRPDHVAAVADMALDIQKTMGTLDETYPGLSIRVGMHTGPVVAGVIGTKKFSYDLWGDTVNVASRMESHGDPGRIQVTPAVADALRGQFVLESRGVIQVKGRGEMETFWLVSRVEPAAVAPARAAAGPAATT